MAGESSADWLVPFLENDTWIKDNNDNFEEVAGVRALGLTQCANKNIEEKWLPKYFAKSVYLRVYKTKRFCRFDNDVSGMVIFIDEPTHPLYPRVYMQPESKEYRKHLLNVLLGGIDYQKADSPEQNECGNIYKFVKEGEIFKHQGIAQDERYWGELDPGNDAEIPSQFTVLYDRFSLNVEKDKIYHLKDTEFGEVEGDTVKCLRYGIRIKSTNKKLSHSSLRSLADRCGIHYSNSKVYYFGSKVLRDEWLNAIRELILKHQVLEKTQE